jgi:fatty acid desaturase
MADLENLFKATEQQSEQRRKALEDRNARLQADDRSRIAKQIIDAFVWLTVLIIAAIIAGTYFLGWDKIVEPVKVIVAIISSVLLPVVTLVIGYYFGNK